MIYQLSIDLTGGKDPNGYFDIGNILIGKTPSSFVNPYVERRGLPNEIKVKNEPYNYAKLGNAKYNLYDIIKSVPATQQMNIKFVSESETIIGYFGQIDCSIDGDGIEGKKEITIKPFILDQYTDILDNSDTEVKLYDESNQVANYDFKQWNGVNPLNWTIEELGTPQIVCERIYFKEKSAVKLPLVFIYPESILGSIWQGISNCIGGKQAVFSFMYSLTGSVSVREALKFKVILSGATGFYYLTEKGQWITTDYTATFKSDALPIDFNTAEFSRFSLTTDKLPESGVVLIYLFHHTTDFNFEDTNLIITNVSFSISAIELKTIKVRFSPENLVSCNEDNSKITWAKRKPRADFNSREFNYQKTLDSFFDVDGKPKQSELIMSDDNSVTLSDVINFFKEQSSLSYGFELSKVQIFKCEYSATKKRRFRAISEFSRDEAYYNVQDENSNWLPPAEGVGWVNISDDPSKGKLWVRFPFDQSTDTWIKSEIKGDPLNFSTHENGFQYTIFIESTKQYPTSAGSEIIINNGIDLREVVRKVYTESHESLRGKNVYSNFIWNDTIPEEDALKLYPNTNKLTDNYVTGARNTLNRIMAIHTFELSTQATSDEDKTILKTTYEKLMSSLATFFPQCYVFIDPNGDWHFEHMKYFEKLNLAKSLLEPQYSGLEYRSWDYVKDKLFSKEEYKCVNSGYLDFAKTEVIFDKIVSNKRGQNIKNTIQSEVISTDIQYCFENKNDLDNGLILLSYDEVNGENICRYGIGQNTQLAFVNGDLSISTLLNTYGTYEGTWETGSINGKAVNFKNSKRSKQGKEITLKGIFLDKIIATDLGIGLIDSRVVDYQNESTKLTALYRYYDKFPYVGFGDSPIAPKSATLDTPTINQSGIAILTLSNITSDGGSPITERGVCWSLSLNPTTSDNKSASGSGTGSYNNGFNVTDAGDWYLRSYAINAIGTAYSANVRFYIQAPLVGSSPRIEIMSVVAVRVTVTYEGSAPVTDRGICWGISANPTLSDNVQASGSGACEFVVGFAKPRAGTYHLRAYAVSLVDTVYSNDITFVIT